MRELHLTELGQISGVVLKILIEVDLRNAHLT